MTTDRPGRPVTLGAADRCSGASVARLLPIPTLLRGLPPICAHACPTLTGAITHLRELFASGSLPCLPAGVPASLCHESVRGLTPPITRLLIHLTRAERQPRPGVSDVGRRQWAAPVPPRPSGRARRIETTSNYATAGHSGPAESTGW